MGLDMAAPVVLGAGPAQPRDRVLLLAKEGRLGGAERHAADQGLDQRRVSGPASRGCVLQSAAASYLVFGCCFGKSVAKGAGGLSAPGSRAGGDTNVESVLSSTFPGEHGR